MLLKNYNARPPAPPETMAVPRHVAENAKNRRPHVLQANRQKSGKQELVRWPTSRSQKSQHVHAPISRWAVSTIATRPATHRSNASLLNEAPLSCKIKMNLRVKYLEFHSQPFVHSFPRALASANQSINKLTRFHSHSSICLFSGSKLS